MKVLVTCLGNKAIGMGHYYRSLELAHHLTCRGADVEILVDFEIAKKVNSDPDITFPVYFISNYTTKSLETLLIGKSLHYDWIVVDYSKELSNGFFSSCRAKVCVLNGIKPIENDPADLRIIQGFSLDHEHSGPKYVIIRREVNMLKAFPEINRRINVPWFVFGGSNDPLNLQSKFPRWPHVYWSERGAVFDRPKLLHRAALTCERAALGMGMTVWELVTLGIPCYVFSFTNIHLRFA